MVLGCMNKIIKFDGSQSGLLCLGHWVLFGLLLARVLVFNLCVPKSALLRGFLSVLKLSFFRADIVEFVFEIVEAALK